MSDGGRARHGKRAKALAFGLGDVGFSSLATLGLGVAAASILSAAQLGVYSILISTAVATAIFPAQQAFVPLERAVIADIVPPQILSAAFSRALRRGLRASVLWGSCVYLTLPLLENSGSWLAAVSAATIAHATCFASSLQDHVRRLSHLLGEHHLALLVSLSQAVVITFGCLLTVLTAQDVAAAFLLPLLAANLVSGCLGYMLLLRRFRSLPLDGATGPTPEISPSSRLLAAALAPQAAVVGSGLVISATASLAAVGAAEAARLLARPLTVITAGVTAVTARVSMRAGRVHNVADARRVRFLFLAAVFSTASLLGPLLLLGPTRTAIQDLVPLAYHAQWLLPLTLLAAAVNALGGPIRAELVGGSRDADIMRVEAQSAALLIALSASGAYLGALARPIAIVISDSVRISRFSHKTRRMYATGQFRER